MKLGKLLKNNVFLVNSSICLVVLLVLCYLGLNYPVKHTYSLDTDYQLFGVYKWNDTISYDEINVYPDVNYELHYYDNTNTLYDNIKFQLYDDLLTNNEDYMAVFYGDTEAFKIYKNSTTVIFTDDNMKYINFNNQNVKVENQLYNWIIANTQPDNHCYVKTSGEYVWTNVPSVGTLRAEITNSDDCKAEVKSYTVTYEPNGGIVSPTSDVVVDGEELQELPIPTYEGYTFIGWYKSNEAIDSEKVEAPYTITEDIKLYAQWKKMDFKVDLNFDNVDGNYIILEYGTTLADLTANISVTPNTYSVVMPDKIATSQKIQIKAVDDKIEEEYIIALIGDVDGDGEISTMDYMYIYAYFKGTKTLNKENELAADIDKDKNITTNDYMSLYSLWKEVK